MECSTCGEPVEGEKSACARCGAALSDDASTPPSATVAPKRRRIWHKLLLAFAAIALFIGALAGATYVGVYVGERDREERRANIIEQHYNAGNRALNDGRYERAAAEFEYILQLNADHGLAAQGLAEAQARLEVKPTPTLEAAQSVAEQLLEQAQASYDRGDWVSTARSLTQLRALDPSYEQIAIEEMLFDSLYKAGQTYLEEDQFEVGISYLDQAIALRPIDADVVAQRNLAARYLDALNYWGVDWELCTERFEALYATAPDYKDVAERLRRARVEYGDYFADRGEMCPAEIQYQEALRMNAAPQVEQKRSEAAQICLAATPVPVSGATPALTPRPISGFATGRLAYPVYNGATGTYDLNALYADGRIIRVTSSADQPWWEWGTGRVAYRDKATGSLRMVLPEEGVPLQLLAPGRQAWPALSSDSQRLAYAAPDADGTWYVYLANTDGTGEPQQLAAGWAPAWSRSGWLAYTGCDAAGACGIFLDHPDDGEAARRLTGSENDVAVSWAPGGNMVAYMSNVAGNWDLFLLSLDGGVQQLTSEPSDEGMPAWSPDGNSLAFVSNREGSGSWDIYVMNLASREVKHILDLGVAMPGWENQRLSWAP